MTPLVDLIRQAIERLALYHGDEDCPRCIGCLAVNFRDMWQPPIVFGPYPSDVHEESCAIASLVLAVLARDMGYR